MAGDVSTLALVKDRLPLIDYHGNNANDQKHSQDRTVALVRKWAGTVDALKAARSAGLQTLEVTEGKGGAVVLKIADRPRFDALQQTIASHQEQIAKIEAAIIALDQIIESNGLAPGYFADLQHRLSSSSGSIYQQKSNITKWLTFHTQKNPRMPPEDVLKLPEFVAKRAEAEKIIKADEAYLAKFKPIVDEIEGILASVGC